MHLRIFFSKMSFLKEIIRVVGEMYRFPEWNKKIKMLSELCSDVTIRDAI